MRRWLMGLLGEHPVQRMVRRKDPDPDLLSAQARAQQVEQQIERLEEAKRERMGLEIEMTQRRTR